MHQIAACSIDGSVANWNYSDAENPKKIFDLQIHSASCRSLDFSPDGKSLMTVSKDRSLQLIDMGTAKVRLRKLNAHSEAINIVKAVSPDLFATGDDSGSIKIWDVRQRKAVRKYCENTDYIADMCVVNNTLFAAGADGCLSVFDLDKNKPVGVSATQDDELLSIQVLRNKVVVGTQSGAIHLFSYGQWGDCTDRFLGHPESVSSLLKTSESTLMSGSSDGLIRSFSVMPNKLQCVVADSSDALAIEKMRMDCDSAFIATCSHDNLIRFWSNPTSNDQQTGKKRKNSDESMNARVTTNGHKAFFADLD